jgi:hypothetical protein
MMMRSSQFLVGFDCGMATLLRTPRRITGTTTKVFPLADISMTSGSTPRLWTSQPILALLSRPQWVCVPLLHGRSLPDFHPCLGTWQKVLPRSVCQPNPGISWESRSVHYLLSLFLNLLRRFDTICSEVWPSERAGHGSALDLKRGHFWIFGGYRTYYPYLSTDSYGASK